MPSPIRVLVVDDSALLRQILTRALSEDPGIEIVGTARDGVEALQKAESLKPDVITLDIRMPALDGIQVLRHLPRHSDARVVVLSSVDDAPTTFLALSLGAIEFVLKPTTGVATSIGELSETLRTKIRTAYEVTPEHATVVPQALRDAALLERGRAEEARERKPATHKDPTVCVGLAASTGGPPALEIVFSGLSPLLPAAYVIVQHLPAGFSTSFARRLSAHCDIRIVEAESGMALESGCGYIAPHGMHLVVATDEDGVRRFQMLADPPIHGVCPSADPLFRSIAATFGSHSVAVVLTGMGVDGASGAAEISHAGGEVIIQDEDSSVIWGMPRAVERAGAAGQIVPVNQIADKIRSAVLARAKGK